MIRAKFKWKWKLSDTSIQGNIDATVKSSTELGSPEILIVSAIAIEMIKK